MAQIAAAEQKQFREQGFWVRERCDGQGCRKAIGFMSWKGRSGKVYCSEQCFTGTEGVVVRHRKREKALQLATEVSASLGRPGTPLKSIEQAILVRMQKEPETEWNTGGLIEVLYKQGVGGKADIRHSIWNLLAAGWVQKAKRNLVLSTNGKQPKLPTKATDMGPSGTTRIRASNKQETHGNGKRSKGKTIKIRDVPTSDE
jgi:hypothetical protein